MQYRTIGDSPKPFYDVAQGLPDELSARSAGRRVEQIERLLAAFRERGLAGALPARRAEARLRRAGGSAAKVPSIMDVPEQGYRFVDEVAPQPGDVLLPKQHPSAFFGTPLASYLIDLGVDTLVVTGCTTSGCVRGIGRRRVRLQLPRARVPHDAVYDRSPTVHAVNLFDMAQKYADVTSTAELLGVLQKDSRSA